ncbi:MAG: phosphoribosylamine--glycine ligase, partial [Armatimonadota bacterium]
MARAGIPTADFAIFSDADGARAYLRSARFPIVVKADGEAAGKGVVVAADFAEADAAIQTIMVDRAYGASGDRVVIEACLEGEEASVMAFVDGSTVVPMVAIQDHKRVGEGDTGPNTGGMGAYAPVPSAPTDIVDQVRRNIL